MLPEYREEFDKWKRLLPRLEIRFPNFDVVEAEDTVRYYLDLLPSQETGEIMMLIMMPRTIHAHPAVVKFLMMQFVRELDARVPPRVIRETRTVYRDRDGNAVDLDGVVAKTVEEQFDELRES